MRLFIIFLDAFIFFVLMSVPQDFINVLGLWFYTSTYSGTDNYPHTISSCMFFALSDSAIIIRKPAILTCNWSMLLELIEGGALNHVLDSFSTCNCFCLFWVTILIAKCFSFSSSNLVSCPSPESGSDSNAFLSREFIDAECWVLFS